MQPPSLKIDQRSDGVGSMAEGRDSDPERRIRMHTRCQHITWDKSRSLSRHQTTNTHPTAAKLRYDKCSPPSLKIGQRSDGVGSMAVGRDSDPEHRIRMHTRCEHITWDES